jgi:hypothetical protein
MIGNVKGKRRFPLTWWNGFPQAICGMWFEKRGDGLDDHL